MRRITAKVVHIDIKFHDNGKLRRMSMIINGNLHGKEYWFYENGKLERIITYVNNKLHIVYWFHENGKLECINTYVNGKIEYMKYE